MQKIIIVAASKDITERKWGEEAMKKAHNELERRVEERTAEMVITNEQFAMELVERKRAEEALCESEERFRSLVEITSDWIWEVDVDSVYTYASPKANELLGYEPEEIIGKTPFDFMPEDEAERLAGLFRDIVQSGKPFSRLENTNICKDGQHVVLETSGVPVLDAHGNVLGYRGIDRDITARKHSETEKKKLQTQLQLLQKLESLGTLAGGIAHDFNNLLMGIQGNISLMLLDMDSTHPFYEMFKNIEKQVKSGAKLTSHLLGYARKGKYEVKPIDLNQLVEDISETFARTRKEITIRRDFADDLLAIEADSGQIEQVLLNLFINASDAMHGGGNLILKTINVTHNDMKSKVYEPKPGNYILLTVTDTGTGMDKRTAKRIFDPFFTTKEMGRGTGLGLASAYGIIKAHGGYIDVESKKGQGTTFRIYLPVSENKVQQVIKTAEGVIKGTGTVLLVDDEEDIVEVGQRLLEALGYRALIAKGGEEAIEIYRKNRKHIDIVVLDMVMPNIGGGKAYDRMKEIDPDVKVLLSSGYSIDGEANEILKRGCNGFIQKPFNINEVSEKIREILEKK
ncbi:MAG: PAS domain S-box protein [Desulfobacterales bacterium]|nr:PAS domain S-box protein [Desulfobacterales bacterium]